MIKKAFLIIFLTVLIVVVIILSWREWKDWKSENETQPEVKGFFTSTQTCGDCLTEIDKIKKELQGVKNGLLTPAVNTMTATPTLILITTPALKNTKEFYIPLGTGTTKSITYIALNTSDFYFDPSLYSKIKEIYFEIGVRIPTANGRVYVKLYNVTDQHDVWYSEVWGEGDKGQYISSPKITLEKDRKRYRVYLRNTMEYDAYLDMARLRIVTE